jgi:hypothetical protein
MANVIHLAEEYPEFEDIRYIAEQVKHLRDVAYQLGCGELHELLTATYTSAREHQRMHLKKGRV